MLLMRAPDVSIYIEDIPKSVDELNAESWTQGNQPRIDSQNLSYIK